MSRSIEWVATALKIAHRSMAGHLPGQCPVLARNFPPPCATRSAHRITTYHGWSARKRQCSLSTGGIQRKAAIHPAPLDDGGRGESWKRDLGPGVPGPDMRSPGPFPFQTVWKSVRLNWALRTPDSVIVSCASGLITVFPCPSSCVTSKMACGFANAQAPS
jgi:hypothetical protein